ncbi:MAG: tRNA epoxyqueuosine(34) reductase QueG, partial [Rubrivivax sp.]
DCQLACPWNRHARRSPLPDFDVREGMAGATLLELWAWDEATFARSTRGSAIARIGWLRWRRNLAVALGNAARQQPRTRPAIAEALRQARTSADELVGEHIDWALGQAG